MRLDKGLIRKVQGPLRKILEAPDYWNEPYSDYHEYKLQMTLTTLDPCLLIRREKNIIDGVIGVQVDENIFFPLRSSRTKSKWRQGNF